MSDQQPTHTENLHGFMDFSIFVTFFSIAFQQHFLLLLMISSSSTSFTVSVHLCLCFLLVFVVCFIWPIFFLSALPKLRKCMGPRYLAPSLLILQY